MNVQADHNMQWLNEITATVQPASCWTAEIRATLVETLKALKALPAGAKRNQAIKDITKYVRTMSGINT